jgi:hypothetical protein
VLYNVSANSDKIGDRPCEHIIVFAQETQNLRLFLLVGFGADAYSFVWDFWVQWYLLEFAFSLYGLFAFYRRLGFILL